MMMKYLWAAFAAASACAQEIASPLPPDQMIAPEDKSVLDSQAKEIFREWDKVAVPVGQSVVALVAGNTQVALGTVVGKGVSPCLYKSRESFRVSSPWLHTSRMATICWMELR